jgi:glycosyltransferase involved in cell wall biosynthesis
MTTTLPLFSLVIAYNEADAGAALLPRAIDSLRRQSCQDFELLLLHDGPRTVPFVCDLVQLACHETGADRRGIGALRQAALSKAQGEFVVQMQPEDLLYDFALEQIVRSMRTPRRRIRIDEASGSFLETLPETEGGDESDIIIYPVIRVGVECDGVNFWMNSKNDRRFGMLVTGRPAIPQLLECMQVAIRRTLWARYGGWYDPSPDGFGTMYARLIGENRARCVPAVLGEHW